MSRSKAGRTIGPIGKGWVDEVRTQDGTRYVARWNAVVLKDNTPTRTTCGPHELGPKVSSHAVGLKSLKQATDAWDKVRAAIYTRYHPPLPATFDPAAPKVIPTSNMTVKDFVTQLYEPPRTRNMEENSRANWEYYRDGFIFPFYFNDRHKYTIAEMNDQDLIHEFMEAVADSGVSLFTAKKAYTYIKAIIDLAFAKGVITTNEIRQILKADRIPSRIKKAMPQPLVSMKDYIALLVNMPTVRDELILKLLQFGGLRRGELFVPKWKDLYTLDGLSGLKIERSFCSMEHKIKPWKGKVAGGGNPKICIPPVLYQELMEFRKSGEDANNPEAFIFPTRKGTNIIPTNWHEDVLRPAGIKAQMMLTPGWVPPPPKKKSVDDPKQREGGEGAERTLANVSYKWFRTGFATSQHSNSVPDKQIQGQMRHAKVETTRNIYMQQVDTETWQSVADFERIATEALKAHKGREGQ